MAKAGNTYRHEVISMPTALNRNDKSIFGDAHWIKSATKNKGGLHHALGIPEGKKIPESRIQSAEHSHSLKTRREANLAETLKHLRSR